MTTVLDREIESDLEVPESGRVFLFWNDEFPDNAMMKFSSTLENIGNVDRHDRILKNKTRVIALSEPAEAHHLTRGPMLVTKIMAHEIMWVSTWSLHEIKE